MKKLFIICILAAGSIVISPAPSWTQGDEIVGEHFVVRYNTARDFAQKVLTKSEYEYDRITKNLGYARYEYWTFEDRCQLYVYGNKESYLRSRPGIPSWSAGYAEISARKIAGYRGSDKFLATVLPHEITHLVFNDFVGGEEHVPKWFSEGVALSQEEGSREKFQRQVGEALHSHYFIPLSMLSDEVFKGVHNYEYTSLAYAEAALLLDFLITRFGPDRFVNLCRGLRDGKELQEAFGGAYQDVLSGLDDLEAKFTQSLSSMN